VIRPPARAPRVPSAVSRFITERPVGIAVVFLAVTVFGSLSIDLLPVELMPEMSYPTLTVRTEYPGAAPEEVENDISRPIEEQLGVVGGLVKVSSISRAGLSDVVLEFSWDTDISDATQDVLEKIDGVFLPQKAERPLILHFDPSLDPVMELSLSGHGNRYQGEGGLRRLRRLAELQVKRDLERISGIAAVRVKGGLEEEIHVSLEEEKLRRTGLSIQAIISRLEQENINLAGGRVKEGRTEYMVRTLNEYEDLQAMRDTIVTRVDGIIVRLADLGSVEWGHKDREIITRTDGVESVQLEIYKEGDANIVDLARRVRDVVGDLPRRGSDAEESSDPKPTGVAHTTGRDAISGSGLARYLFENEEASLEIIADRSIFIASSIREVLNTALLGGVLAIAVLLLFLRKIKPTLIIGLSIPVSLLITFAPLNMLGISLNIMSLGGLALGIGMLVDSSIVVLESIVRCIEEGDSLKQAAMRGTQEVRSAVIASTLTSIAVFFPMVFVEGVAGQAFGDLGLAVVVSLLASMGVALFLIPMLVSRSGFSRDGKADSQSAATKPFRELYGSVWSWRKFKAYHTPLKRWTLFLLPLTLGVFLISLALECAAKLVLIPAFALVVLLTVATFKAVGTVIGLLLFIVRPLNGVGRSVASGYSLLLRGCIRQPFVVAILVAGVLVGTYRLASRLDSELLPEVHQDQFTVEVALPVGTPLDETDKALAAVEQAILSERESIRSLLLMIGYDSANSKRSDEGEHSARFQILLDSGGDPAETERRVVARLRKLFAGLPDVEARVTRPVLFSFKSPIEVEVHGHDLYRLRLQAEKVREALSGLPALADVETTQKPGAPEVQIIYDRDRLTRYGLNIGEVARRVRDKVQGFEATRFNLKDRRVPIVVRLALSDRETVEDVRALIVNPGAERPIRLASVADVTLGEGPSEVRRVDGRRVALVRANLGEGTLSVAAEQIENALRNDVDWPAGMTWYMSGQNEEWERSRRTLLFALGLGAFLVYVIMAAQFESLIHPLVIMLTIPLAFVGTFVAMSLLKLSLSIVVFLGMIMLAGIVVNNAIVLVDYINQLRERGMPRDEAIALAGKVRLRPIMMTTATTVLGLLPMALGLGEGSELRTPMAISVISGLLASTVLTLLVIPAFYALIDRTIARLLGRETAFESRPEKANPSGTGQGVVHT